MIYSAGECAVCQGAGDALFVRSIEDGRIFFFCADCGCAWPQPPTPGRVDTIAPPELFAPAGFTLATSADIRTAGWAHRIAVEHPDTHVPYIDDFVGFRRSAAKGESRAPAG